MTKIRTDYNMAGQEENVHSVLLNEMRSAMFPPRTDRQ